MSLTDLPERLSRRAITLGLGLGLATLSLIGVIGMATSVVIVENVQGSASAINVSGSLRMQSHRMGGLVLAAMMDADPDRQALDEAMARFETSLRHRSLRTIQERAPDSEYARLYRRVQTEWETDLKPMLNAEADRNAPDSPQRHHELLARIDVFVADINRMVAQLENDTEAKIGQLHSLLAVSLTLTFVVMLAVLYGFSKRVILPLNRLVEAANAIARGDFTARASHIGRDELGRVGVAFNFMTDELSKLYANLEQRVNEKTEQLTRSNRSLELLYHSIARLYNAPVAPETYRALLTDLEQVLDLSHSMACLLPEPGGQPRILASTATGDASRGMCAGQDCAGCAHHEATWDHAMSGGGQVHAVPLKDAEQRYGILQVALPPGRHLEAWQEQLIEALSQHIGIAIGIARQTERERRLALMDERSVIARELHDSLAQALSYMKIQVVLLQQALRQEAGTASAEAILKDLREGINAAYRQLRELLATFRLRMEGDFMSLLGRTTAEYAERGGLEIALDARMGAQSLAPNQEIHVLQIVREALNNVLRHAEAKRAWVTLATHGTAVVVAIEDDGQGIPDAAVAGDHYGLTIMRERAHSLNGELRVLPRQPCGTRVELSFDAGDGSTQSAFEEATP
ncbi:HAMP domain-containing protein [Parasulfuritortus cantonensis]|uniref:Sensor protein n=1 Tax=Parasulfuritortus cantonensis TaxID=2528202 RepID=A0A4R1BGP1_9PROT|nr:type IV pili methyl-accepting chemotaxis transducer N-terminal domain-containing protein [Parasulfuritortus cantonensis]TCJ16361.1 HAMP domain-containing protein [Parasulfuritortus cantonensis]